MHSGDGLKLYNRVYHSSFASLFQAKSLHFHVNILNSPRKRGSFRALNQEAIDIANVHLSIYPETHRHSNVQLTYGQGGRKLSSFDLS